MQEPDLDHQPILVFSYGSLKIRYPECKSYQAVLEDYLEIDNSGMFPILTKSSTINYIEGYILEVTKEQLKSMDLYEGYPEIYNRVEKMIGSNNIPVWVYIEP